MITKSQIERVTKDYSSIAKEPVTIEVEGHTLYAFGSEVATLRLFRSMPHVRQEFSENLNTWYISFNLPTCLFVAN